VALRDGSTVRIRPVHPDDEPLLLEFLRSLDERSLASRFFTGAPNLEADARALAEVDGRRRFGLLALRGEECRPVAHACYAAIDDDTVEVAFEVNHELQDHGLGTILLFRLAEHAAENGFTGMVAEVMPGNRAMIEVFCDSGLKVAVRREPDSVVVEMATSPMSAAIGRRVGAATPASVGSNACVGASDEVRSGS